MARTVARTGRRAYVAAMSETPAFLDGGRPPVPHIVVPRGVTPFFLPRQPVRGRLIRLGKLADALLTRHDNAPAVTRLAGQALALAAGLSAALKFRGSFSLQAKGDGPVRQLLADCTDTGELRFYARTDADRLAALLAEDARPAADQLLGAGYLAFTVDQGPDLNRHQGIVTIEGATLAEMALHYFRTVRAVALLRSPGLRTRPRGNPSRRLAGRRADPGEDRRRGRRRPVARRGRAGGELDHRHHARRHAERLGAARRVAAAGAPAVPPVPQHGRGDRPRAGAVVRLPLLAGAAGRHPGGFPPDDLDHMTVDGDIIMTCEFCNFDFRFPRDAIGGGQ